MVSARNGQWREPLNSSERRGLSVPSRSLQQRVGGEGARSDRRSKSMMTTRRADMLGVTEEERLQPQT